MGGGSLQMLEMVLSRLIESCGADSPVCSAEIRLGVLNGRDGKVEMNLDPAGMNACATIAQ
jgi:hypothetical protein